MRAVEHCRHIYLPLSPLLPDMRSFVYLLLCLIPLSVASAQHSAISGVLLDSASGTPLVHATVEVRNSEGKVFGDYTDKKGYFLVHGISGGSYSVDMRSLGYKDIKRTLKLKDNDTLVLGTIRLAQSSVLTNTIEVEAQQIRGEQRGDTTEFNAKAFKTDKNASAEDLVKKMPGVEVENGTVKAQGEQVKRVLVDGKPFFGDDPATTLKTLPSDIIDKVQVYDQSSDQAQFTRFDDGERNKTLNVITKADKRVGQFGKLYAGYGTDSRYNAGGNINYFNGDQRISLLGIANNINEQNFAIQDIIGAMGGGGTQYMRMAGRSMAMFTTSGGGKSSAPRGPGSGGDFSISPNDGISKSSGLGLNYTDQFGRDFAISGSYFFNRTATAQYQTVDRTYIINDTLSQLNPQINNNNPININHRLNLRADYSIDSMSSILLNPKFTLQNSVKDNTQYSEISNSTPSALQSLSQTTTKTGGETNAYNFSTDLLYRLRFATEGRTFSAQLNGTFRNNDGTGRNTSSVTAFLPDTITNVYDLSVPSDGNTKTLSANLSYTEPVATNHQLQLTYNINDSKTTSDKLSYLVDSSGAVDTNPISLLSSKATSEYLTQRPGLSYRFSILPPDSMKKKFDPMSLMGGPPGGDRGMGNRMMGMMGGSVGTWTFGVGAEYQIATLQTTQTFPSALDGSKTFYNILPNFSMVARPSMTSNIRLNYRTSTSSPSISQLQDVIDNTDPIHLSRGNSNLKQEFNHSLFANYGVFNMITASGFFVMANVNLTQDKIVNSTRTRGSILGIGDTLPVGSQFTMPINRDGYINANSFIVYSFPVEPFKGLKLNMNTNVGLMYTRDLSLIDSAENVAKTLAVTPSLGFSSNISEYTDFSVSARTAYSTLRNSLQSSLNTNYYTTTVIARANVISHDSSALLDGWVGSVDFNYVVTSGLAAGYNTAVPLLNFGIGKRFFDQRAELKLSVFDVLNKNNTVSRTTSSGYFEDSQTRVLNRYFLLTFSYNLRIFGSKQ